MLQFICAQKNHWHRKYNDIAVPCVLRYAVVTLLIAGGLFRFAGLDQKPYSGDETGTLLRIAGFNYKEIHEQLYDGRVIDREQLKKYQQPNAEKNLVNTVTSLASDEPQHVPIYFIMARLWAEWVGTSVTATRLVPALISLLVLPGVYWLCRELFTPPSVGWVAMGIIAVSPVHVVYAQNARPYSLFTLVIILSSAVLLRAMRVRTRLSWVLYAATVACSLYAYLLCGLVFIGHGLYVIGTERFRWSKLVGAYALASLIGLGAFVPWLMVIANSLATAGRSLDWLSRGVSLLSLVKSWALDFSRVFVDSGYLGYDLGAAALSYLVPLSLTFCLVAVYAIYFLCRHTSRRAWLFVLTLIGSTALPLVLTDVVLARRMSAANRYLMPAYVGMQLAIAYLLAVQTNRFSRPVWRRRFWMLISIGLIVSGVVSCTMMARAVVWWSTLNTLSVERVVNRAACPLVLSDAHGVVFSLIHRLGSNVRFQLFYQTMPSIADGYTDVFVYDSSETFRAELAKIYQLEWVDKRHKLWRLKAPPKAECSAQ